MKSVVSLKMASIGLFELVLLSLAINIPLISTDNCIALIGGYDQKTGFNENPPDLYELYHPTNGKCAQDVIKIDQNLKAVRNRTRSSMCYFPDSNTLIAREGWNGNEQDPEYK